MLSDMSSLLFTEGKRVTWLGDPTPSPGLDLVQHGKDCRGRYLPRNVNGMLSCSCWEKKTSAKSIQKAMVMAKMLYRNQHLQLIFTYHRFRLRHWSVWTSLGRKALIIPNQATDFSSGLLYLESRNRFPWSILKTVKAAATSVTEENKWHTTSRPREDIKINQGSRYLSNAKRGKMATTSDTPPLFVLN